MRIKNEQASHTFLHEKPYIDAGAREFLTCISPCLSYERERERVAKISEPPNISAVLTFCCMFAALFILYTMYQWLNIAYAGWNTW